MPDNFVPAISHADQGSFLVIEVSAGSKRSKFPDGFNPWRNAVGIQVQAQATEGKANKAIISLIAERLQLSKTSVHIISGQTSSVKRILIESVSPEELEAMLRKIWE
jgi:uncharacterized protein